MWFYNGFHSVLNTNWYSNCCFGLRKHEIAWSVLGKITDLSSEDKWSCRVPSKSWSQNYLSPWNHHQIHHTLYTTTWCTNPTRDMHIVHSGANKLDSILPHTCTSAWLWAIAHKTYQTMMLSLIWLMTTLMDYKMSPTPIRQNNIENEMAPWEVGKNETRASQFYDHNR